LYVFVRVPHRFVSGHDIFRVLATMQRPQSSDDRSDPSLRRIAITLLSREFDDSTADHANEALVLLAVER